MFNNVAVYNKLYIEQYFFLYGYRPILVQIIADSFIFKRNSVLNCFVAIQP